MTISKWTRMKETDGEISIAWPSWCYFDKINCNELKCFSDVEKRFSPDLGTDSTITEVHETNNCSNNRRYSKTYPPLTAIIVDEKKMLSERSLLLSGYINGNTVESAKKNCDTSNTRTSPLTKVSLPGQGAGLIITPTTTAAAAAAYLYLENTKNERMSPRVTTVQFGSLKDAIMESSAAAAVAAAIVNNNNTICVNSNNNTNYQNSNNSDISIESNCGNGNSSISNNLVSNQVQNRIANNSNNNTSDDLPSQSLILSSNNQLKQKQHLIQKQQSHRAQQQQQLTSHMSSNDVKKERLSPGTNGDLPTSLSRSRSTTPSSFRETSPQNSVHSSPSETIVPVHNISTNLLNSIHQAATSSPHGNLSVSPPRVTSANSGLPSDFSTRNYSDFMRSLAAKYNNANPNDNLKRTASFEVKNITSTPKKDSAASQRTTYASTTATQLNKEVTITTTSSLPPPAPLAVATISHGESAIKLSQQNKIAAAVANAAAACSNNVSPFMTSFLSTIPGIFPPLIDMSSTQALITLARAAKENEIHNILSVSSQQSKRSADNTAPSASPTLNMALQQAAQFISPALIYSAQLQKQQHIQNQVERHSSPNLASISNSTTTTSAKRNEGYKVNVSPLDLSSQPPTAKRFKDETTSSQSSTDGLMNSAVTRRSSSSTATYSPSPPPLQERFLNTSANAVSFPATTLTTLACSRSTKPEEPLSALTSIKVASSTSAIAALAPAVTVRQCQAQSEELNSWTVDDVCAFVGSIDICTEYVKHFRDQCIDGSGLPLLTEDHLVNSLGMKLGPALKLRSVLARKLGGPCPCVSCVAQVQQLLALQTSGMTGTTAATADPATSNNPTNISAFGSDSKSSCNSHVIKNALPCSSSTNCNSQKSSSANSLVNRHKSAAATTVCSTNTSACNSDGLKSNTTRSNSSFTTNENNFSSPPAPPAGNTEETVTQQPQQHLHHQQKSPSQEMCTNKNNCNATTNRHDNADPSS